jgi:metal transporter CNNM
MFGVDASVIVWIGIVFCITQSAMFSGLNLAFFSLSRLELEVESTRGNVAAQKVLALREDSNFLLATILWGNVGINVMLTMLSDSVLAGVSAFMFSTVAITLMGEIAPQAYFSRHALKMASKLSLLIRFYQILLFPVAKLSALILDGWLGKEGINYMAERDLKHIIRKHIEADEAEIDHVEGIGALNFLSIDDLTVSQEGELLDPASIIQLESTLDLPTIPPIKRSIDDEFIKQLHLSGHGWVVLTDTLNNPLLVIDVDGFIRAALLDDGDFDPYLYSHRPIVITDPNYELGEAMKRLRGIDNLDKHQDVGIDKDVILVWSTEKRIITGSDILGRLLKGIDAE